MTTTFLLVRHATCASMAEALFGRTVDASLDDGGHAQAAALGERLAAFPGIPIHASPRLRARQTAEAIAERTRSTVSIADDLDEVDFGRWAGCTFAALSEDPDWRTWNSCRDTARTPGGETMRTLSQRIVDHLQRTQRQCSTGRVVLVSHAEPIRAVLMHYLGVPSTFYDRLPIAPASVSALRSGEHTTTVELINDSGKAIQHEVRA